MKDILAKSREFVNSHRNHIWGGVCLLLIGWSAYNVGILSAQKGAQPLQNTALFSVRDKAIPQETSGTSSPQNAIISEKNTSHSDPRVVVSKTSSSKKYHYSWCSGAKRIKPENQVWFPTADAAQTAGYTLASNCH